MLPPSTLVKSATIISNGVLRNSFIMCVCISTNEGVSVLKIFNNVGYKVVKMDRAYYVGLTKKDISRGRYRFLSDKEVSMLKMI